MSSGRIEEKIHEGIHKYCREAGRAYVQAYVPFLHFVERLYNVTPPRRSPTARATWEEK